MFFMVEGKKASLCWELCSGCGRYRCKRRTCLEVGQRRIDIIRIPLNIPYAIAVLGNWVPKEGVFYSRVNAESRKFFY